MSGFYLQILYKAASVSLLVCGLLAAAAMPAWCQDIPDRLVRFKVMSYNVRGCVSIQTKKPDPRGITAPITQIRPDILGVQEMGCLEDIIRVSGLPHHKNLPSAKGPHKRGGFWTMRNNGIFSKWPFKADSVELPGHHKHQTMFLNHALIMVEGVPVSFYLTHLTNWGYSTWKGMAGEYIGRGPRVAQMQRVVAALENDPYRYKVLVGDLNSTPLAKPWRMLSEQLEDAFPVTYLTGTRRTSWANLIRIDHIFTSPDVRVEKAWVVKAGESDHYPVAARLAIRMPGAEHDSQKVMKAQNTLKRLGFFNHTPDGAMGAATRKAIADYQARLGLPVDGCLSPETLKALLAGRN